MPYLTMHQRNLAAVREREQKEAEIPGKVAEVLREIESALIAHFPRSFDPDRDLPWIADWLQMWLRQRFPDRDEYPGIVARLNPQNPTQIDFPGVVKFLEETIREEEKCVNVNAKDTP